MKYQIQKNSKRQKIFEFLAEYPYSTNELLYSQFNARTKSQKANVRDYKQQFLKKYKKSIPPKQQNNIHTLQDHQEIYIKHIDEIIQLYKKNIKRSNFL